MESVRILSRGHAGRIGANRYARIDAAPFSRAPRPVGDGSLACDTRAVLARRSPRGGGRRERFRPCRCPDARHRGDGRVLPGARIPRERGDADLLRTLWRQQDQLPPAGPLGGRAVHASCAKRPAALRRLLLCLGRRPRANFWEPSKGPAPRSSRAPWKGPAAGTADRLGGSAGTCGIRMETCSSSSSTSGPACGHDGSRGRGPNHRARPLQAGRDLRPSDTRSAGPAVRTGGCARNRHTPRPGCLHTPSTEAGNPSPSSSGCRHGPCRWRASQPACACRRKAT